MNDYEEHTTNGKDIKGGWVMVFVVGLGFVILSL